MGHGKIGNEHIIFIAFEGKQRLFAFKKRFNNVAVTAQKLTEHREDAFLILNNYYLSFIQLIPLFCNANGV
jgi:hypothetical protein